MEMHGQSRKVDRKMTQWRGWLQIFGWWLITQYWCGCQSRTFSRSGSSECAMGMLQGMDMWDKPRNNGQCSHEKEDTPREGEGYQVERCFKLFVLQTSLFWMYFIDVFFYIQTGKRVGESLNKSLMEALAEEERQGTKKKSLGFLR